MGRRNGTILFAISRLIKILALTLALGVAFSFRKFGGLNAGPRLLRWYLQTCGAGFVKFGQFLAMRYDLLPAEYCEELSKLLDHLPPLPASTIIRVIESDLRLPLELCFFNFDPQPAGSASLAQAHKAQLLTGERVIVKVMRPGVERRMSVDLAIMRTLGRVIDSTHLLYPASLRGLVAEVDRLTAEELDFRREARNAHLMWELMREDSIDHRAPRVYFEFSNLKVITLEQFEGVWMSELLSAINCDDQERLHEFAERGITPQRTARLLFRSIMEQCYHHRFFHCDPHAANLILLEGGTLGYIDFGMVGWLDEKTWSQQYRLFEYISKGNIHASFEAMVETLMPLTVLDLTEFETAYKNLLHDWLIAVRSPNTTIIEKSTGRFLLRASDAIRRAGLYLPWTLMRLHRTTIISDMVELRLYPDIDLVTEMDDFFREEACRQAGSLISGDQIQSALLASIGLGVRAPSIAQVFSVWLETRLPGLARDYGLQFSRFEQLASLLLHYLRNGARLLILAMLILWGLRIALPEATIAQLPAGNWFENLGWFDWALLFLGVLLISRMLSKMISNFEDSS